MKKVSEFLKDLGFDNKSIGLGVAAGVVLTSAILSVFDKQERKVLEKSQKAMDQIDSKLTEDLQQTLQELKELLEKHGVK